MELIWRAAGSPIYPSSHSGSCRLCDQSGIGLPFDGWVRDTFTDHDKLSSGAIICQACQFGCDEASEPLAKLTGKDKPQRMRNYSHFVVDGAWEPLSKGHKRRMREILISQPAVAIIAVSGQKHIIFRARPGWWQVEEATLLPCPDLLTLLLDPIERLYNAGASKAEIETGRFSQKTLLKIGLPLWRDCTPILAPYRGGLPLQLALFLAQKETPDDDT